jgi:hypothetical protein
MNRREAIKAIGFGTAAALIRSSTAFAGGGDPDPLPWTGRSRDYGVHPPKIEPTPQASHQTELSKNAQHVNVDVNDLVNTGIYLTGVVFIAKKVGSKVVNDLVFIANQLGL